MVLLSMFIWLYSLIPTWFLHTVGPNEKFQNATVSYWLSFWDTLHNTKQLRFAFAFVAVLLDNLPLRFIENSLNRSPSFIGFIINSLDLIQVVSKFVMIGTIKPTLDMCCIVTAGLYFILIRSNLVIYIIHMITSILENIAAGHHRFLKLKQFL